ncbi:hypothetical protein B0H13DRAFT_2523959 [Mycena leptocephala]|nr:hypothetical protein B0H13DRAFT_2523959 [Mycena leptocephala]
MCRKERTTALATTPQEQCLRNSDLLDQILRALMPRSPNAQETRLGRVTLNSAALTSRAFSYSAVKILWRRLDNLLPLLSLLPSFEHCFYTLSGIMEDADWETFDRHALYVREIIYSRTWPGPVDPLAYMRLAKRKFILLPNLSRFECSSDPCGPDFILYISPSLVSLRLESSEPSETETFLNMLSVEASPLSELVIAHQQNTVLLFCNLFRNLQSIDLKVLSGPVTDAAFLALASLPLLRSLTTDMSGWDKLGFQSIAPGSIFCALTHLNVAAIPGLLRRNIPLFLPLIGATCVVSITVIQSHNYSGWQLPSASAETLTTIAQCIASRWPTTLRNLQLEGLACTADDFSSIQGLTNIQTLELKQTLQGSLSDARILAIVRTWSQLTSLTIEGADADMEFIKCLAQHCPMLRSLHVDFFPHPLPDIRTTPALAHTLYELRFARQRVEHRWSYVDIHLLARHLDRLFPRVASIAGEGTNHRWRDVEKLVLMCQDVRRTAWEQK